MTPAGEHGRRRFLRHPAARATAALVVALGDVAGKGSPAALLMALLLAMLRTLVDEELEPAALVDAARTCRSAGTPASRFITLFYARLHAGDRRADLRQRRAHAAAAPAARRRYERLGSTGVALGMFEDPPSARSRRCWTPGEMLVLYSDGITEAEDPAGQPFEEAGLEMVVERHATAQPAEIGTRILAAVAEHAKDSRFTDDLTILVLKRAACRLAAAASVTEADIRAQRRARLTA